MPMRDPPLIGLCTGGAAGQASGFGRDSLRPGGRALNPVRNRMNGVGARGPPLLALIGRPEAVAPGFSYCPNRTVVDVWTGKVCEPPFSIRPLKISRNPTPL